MGTIIISVLVSLIAVGGLIYFKVQDRKERKTHKA